MGCSSSYTASGEINSKDFDSSEPLTRNEIELIKRSWDSIEKKDDFGLSLMIRIFTTHQEVKHKWIFAANLDTVEEMKSNSQVRYHSRKIIDVFDKIVNILMTSSSMGSEEILKLGRNHFHYGVRKDDFHHFEESLFYALKLHISDHSLNVAKTEKAWHKIFGRVAYQLSQGIEKEELDQFGTPAKNNNSENNNR